MFVAAASIWCCGKKIRLSTSHTIAPLTKHISVKVAARGRQASNRGVTSGAAVRSISLPLYIPPGPSPMGNPPKTKSDRSLVGPRATIQFMPRQCSQPNPHGADIVKFKVTHHTLRNKFSASGKPAYLDKLQAEYDCHSERFKMIN